MRALFVIDSLGAGGAERSLQEMLPTFQKSGISPIVACFHRRGEGVSHLMGQADVRFLDGRPRIAQVRDLNRLIRDERIELVHTSLFEADVLGRTATAGTGAAVVTSLVNMPYEPARLEHDAHVNRAGLLAVRSLEIVTGALFADRFHAITNSVKRAAARSWLIPPGKITVVYRGRDEARLGSRSSERRSRVRQALGIEEGTFVVLTAGRQEYQKGQVHLVEAFDRIVEEHPNSVLLIAGRAGGATEALNAAIARRSSRSKIRCLGHRDDVPDLMAASDVFVLPSLWEGLGCVLIEAMALELPVVASDLPPVREACDDGACAILVRPQDSSGLARAVGEMRSDRTRAAELARRGRALYESRYTVERSALGMLEIFMSALSERRKN